MLSKIFEFTEGDYDVVEFSGRLRFRHTGFQRAADASTLNSGLQEARLMPNVIDVTSPIDGRKLSTIRSTNFDSNSGKYLVATNDGHNFELTADEAATMLRLDKL